MRRALGRVAALLAATSLMSFVALKPSEADNDTRTLKLYNIHTKEHAVITFKQNGQYVPGALRELNHFLRDWRADKEIEMDPYLFDLIWQVYQATGAQKEVYVVCGFRTPSTNSLLRSRSSGVAENSQHTHGKAMDFFIPDVPLAKLREIGLRMQAGGVGFYPESGSPFVHLDTGSVRMWPRMSHDQLAAVFPDGKTLYVPSDGKPLQGYSTALAEYKLTGTVRSVASLGVGNVRTGTEPRTAAPTQLALASETPGAVPLPRPAPDRRSRTGGGDPASAGRAPAAQAPAVLAYAGGNRGIDPFSIVTGSTQRTETASAAAFSVAALPPQSRPAIVEPERPATKDTLAALTFSGSADWSFWSGGGSTRQAAFVRLSTPDLRLDTPLAERPQRSYVAHFSATGQADLRTDRFDLAAPASVEVAEFIGGPTRLASR